MKIRLLRTDSLGAENFGLYAVVDDDGFNHVIKVPSETPALADYIRNEIAKLPEAILI